MKVAINILPLKNANKYRGVGYYTLNLLESFKKESDIEILEFSDIAELNDVDLVHYPFFDLFFHTLPIKKLFPTVVTVHDLIPLIFSKKYPVGLKGRINFYLQRFALQNCKFIITDSDASKEDITRLLKIKDKKIVTIPLATDSSFKILSDAEPLRVKRKYNLPDRFLLFVGDANYSKNLPFLIKGFNKLIKQSGFKNLKLVLIGGVFLRKVEGIDHPELVSLKQVNRLIEELKIQDKVIRPGNVGNEELVAFYNLAKVYIQPSLYEGFGLPTLQAFSCGTPVISSNAGSLIEVGGNAAVYFDPTDLGQLVAVTGEVLKNKSLRAKLSKLGLAQSAKFSWEKVARQTMQVYSKAAKKNE